jgi:nicotinamide mononucleotide transporter
MNNPISLFIFSTTPLELVSFTLAFITVALNIRQVHWAWLFSILSSALYGVVFFNAKLYGDMGLQGVFIVVSLWGWVQWLNSLSGPYVPVDADNDIDNNLRVSGLTWPQRYTSLLGWILGFFVLAWFLKSYTDTDVPHMDGFLTAGSLLGQLLLSRKKWENWLVWIAVDILYVGLYVYKGLMLTAILYAVFVVLAVIGLRVWNKTL